ncbi:hypothetical protein PI124_g8812 [Phytophthora idaei]|nr:hypothetical protein PI125_g16711 [Phytophthora idaei]KAG3246470.1 hypothetical protein PI124_g8812 [Phytophthora idaei]
MSEAVVKGAVVNLRTKTTSDASAETIQSTQSDNENLVARVASIVELERRQNQEELPTIGARVANTKFWVKMRDILLVNKASVGADQLDDAAEAFNATRPRNGRLSRHPDHQAHRVRLLTQGVRRGASGGINSVASAARHVAHVCTLAPGSPQVKRDLERLYKSAHKRGLPIEQVQYPWEGQRLFYDPVEFSNLYLAHWRIWMTIRYAAFEWGLHAHLNDKAAQAQRRKRKMAAHESRLRFTSLCFETLGYFDTLHRLKETGHRNLLWWGGQPGRNNSDKKYKSPTISDLGVLLHSDKEAYLKKMQSASKPFKLDQDSFQDLPSMLAFTDAPDPELAKPESRLSNRALARTLVDNTTFSRTPRGWVGNLTNGVWLELCQNRRIRDLHVDVLLELKANIFRPTAVPPFDPTEAGKPH